MALGQTLVWAGLFYCFPALLVRWESDLGWTRDALTGAIALALFMSALASPLAGRLIDAGKGPQMMAGATLLGAAALVSLIWVDQLWQFYLVWAFMGMMLGGCLYEPCFALITRARGADAKRAITLVTLFAGFASTISFPMAHAIAEAHGWRSAIVMFAAIAAFASAPLTFAGARTMEQTGKGSSDSRSPSLTTQRHSFLRRPVFWFLAIGFALGAVLHGATLHHLLPILYDRGLSPDLAVFAASFIGPMQVAGRLMMMATEKHVSNHGVAMMTFMMMGLSILLLIGAGATHELVIGFVILFGSAYGVTSIIRPVIAREILGESNFGAKSGVIALLYLSGAASSPYVGALVWSAGGYDLLLPCLIVLAVLGLSLYLVARRLSGDQGTSAQAPKSDQ